MNIWLVMLLGGVITFLIRFSLIYLFGRFKIPETMQQALRYVPPAVLSALIFPELFFREGALNFSVENTRLLEDYLPSWLHGLLGTRWSQSSQG
ncbi:MAG TPA: AzlD domain-containing protein [Anaerolineales bacterium]|nr:AzlD domain-containing protein [Anaerolineales bacterium]